MVGEVTVVVLVLSEALAGVAELGGKEALLLQQLRELRWERVSATPGHVSSALRPRA